MATMHFLMVALPLASMFSVICTMIYCYVLWFPNRKDKSLYIPAISELGVGNPQHFYYQLGFGLTGFLLGVHMKGFEFAMAKHLAHGEYINQEEPAEAVTVQSCIKYGLWAAFGCVLQGLFTLQAPEDLSAQSFVHWAGAIIFMVGAQRHAATSSELYSRASKYIIENEVVSPMSEDSFVAWAARLRNWLLENTSTTSFMIIILAQLVSHVYIPKDGFSAMNMLGLVQWIIIGQFAVYFMTYALDVHAALVWESESMRACIG